MLLPEWSIGRFHEKIYVHAGMIAGYMLQTPVLIGNVTPMSIYRTNYVVQSNLHFILNQSVQMFSEGSTDILLGFRCTEKGITIGEFRYKNANSRRISVLEELRERSVAVE